MGMNRREFVSWVSVSAIITSVVGCSTQESNSDPQAIPESLQRSDGFLVVGTIAELEENSSLTSDVASVIVIRSPSNDLIALGRTCPHQGCAVSLTESRERLSCPCHGAEFTIRGELLQGPATSPLPTYEVKTEGDQVLVKVT